MSFVNQQSGLLYCVIRKRLTLPFFAPKIKSTGIVASSAPFVTSGLLANPPSERLRHASFGAGGMAGADIGSLARSKHFELAAVADVDLKRAEGIL